MKLISLKLNPRGGNGWESPLLEFGRRTTSLHGPNGSGKTPLVQAIPYCLGFDIKFQNDIREKCHSATLVIEHNNQFYKFSRDFGDFRIVAESGESRREFFNERDFSDAIFQEFNLTVPILVGTNRQATKPYLSSLLPIFYVRQIGGYDEPYRPPAQFILDQFAEMIRFAFGLGPKRSYTAQKELLAARGELDAIQRRIVFQQKVIADLSAHVDDSLENRNQLTQRATLLNIQVTDIRESADTAGAANDALQELLYAKEERVRILRRQYSELSLKAAGISSIRSEIEGEIQTLSLNEESKRVFESFFDICGRSDCGLFESSKASYAKSLIYLKDQIKDIEANANRAETQLEILNERIIYEESDRANIAQMIDNKNKQEFTDNLVSTVQALTRELIETEQKLTAISQLSEEKKKYLQFDQDRERSRDRIANLTNRGKHDLKYQILRTKIQELTVKWMDVLGTPNASRDVDIDLDFKFRFGKQTIDVFNGSTRSRIILAIHAALFELYLQSPEQPFRFLILDTPKQQELASEDLAKYLHALEDVCDELGGQILISSTEYRHMIGENDREWVPEFPGGQQNMYLGNSLI